MEDVAQMSVIAYDQLVKGDSEATEELLRASQTKGFFYLNLRSNDKILGSVADCFTMAKEVMDLSLDEKLSFHAHKRGVYTDSGYKPAGFGTGLVPDKRDGHETFQISSDEVDHIEHRTPEFWPTSVIDHRTSVQQFAREARSIATTIMKSLSKSLGVSEGSSFELTNRPGERSPSATALLKYPPTIELPKDQLGHAAHTDGGSITVLFAPQPGLQICDTDMEWKWVQPHPGYAVVNIGDALHFISRGTLKSALHRVVPHPDLNRATNPVTRYSLAYFLRPELAASFVDNNGKVWTGDEWQMRKFASFHDSVETQLDSGITTGRKGYYGYWNEAETKQEQKTAGSTLLGMS